MGIFIAVIIICFWAVHLIYILNPVEFNLLNPVVFAHILIQAYLYTGLFITAHDAMHKTVSRNRFVNDAIGYIASFAFAGMSYKRLIKNHMDHHRYPGTEKDPDFNASSNNFWIWWLKFMFRYTTLTQLITMGIIFNVLNIWFDEINIWLFWALPAFLGSLQLFYFGTYLPHKIPHTHEMEPHKARTQSRNHLLAMLTCYFFGYHFEHHEKPYVPWWQLYKLK